MIIVALAVLGLLGILGGVLAARSGAKLSQAAPSAAFATRLRLARLSGYALAVATWPLTGLMSYSYVDDVGRSGRVAGVPFMAAYFNSHGHDFVGPMTIVGLIGNAVFWGLLPRLAVVSFALVAQRWRPRSPPGDS